jgi:hypothetical protein
MRTGAFQIGKWHHDRNCLSYAQAARMEGVMRPTGWYVIAGLAALIGAAATAQAAVGEQSGDSVRFPPATVVYPGTREFRWTVRVPVVTIEQREFAFKAPTGLTRPQRWDYEGPAVRTERRKIGSYPDFSCKYIDWSVSNECRTVWRGIYADLPVIVTRPQHLVFDMPDWRWKTQSFPISVPRWAWKEEHWTVSLPVIVREPGDDAQERRPGEVTVPDELSRARANLEAKEHAALAALDEGLRALERSIVEVEAHAADPARVETADGNMLDLIAVRAELRDQRAATERAFRRIAGELDAAARAANAAIE